MRFLVIRTEFLRMLSIVTVDNSTPPQARGELVRIHAEHNLLSVSCSGDEAQCSALVASRGVCFLRHVKLRELLRAYSSDERHQDEIEIEVTPHSIRFGETLLPRGGWEISLFLNPELAPQELRMHEEFLDERTTPVHGEEPCKPSQRGLWDGPD